MSYYKLKRYEDAISAYTRAIEINQKYGYAYLERGSAKEMLKDMVGACADWQKAFDLGVTVAGDYVKTICPEFVK